MSDVLLIRRRSPCCGVAHRFPTGDVGTIYARTCSLCGKEWVAARRLSFVAVGRPVHILDWTPADAASSPTATADGEPIGSGDDTGSAESTASRSTIPATRTSAAMRGASAVHSQRRTPSAANEGVLKTSRRVIAGKG